MTFDTWQRWGAALDDVSFANAWVALGLASDQAGHRSVVALQSASWSQSTVRWTFPAADTVVQGTPQEWARAWVEAARRIPPGRPPRLRVENAAPDEPIRPWLRMLGEADPVLGGVSLLVAAPRAQLQMGWPLRLGSLSADGEKLVAEISQRWPSSKVARGIRLSRDSSSCDVLVHPGPAKQLLAELLKARFGLKANILVLRGGDEPEWGEAFALLAAALAQARASAFVVLPSTLEDAALAETVNGLVREMSHANPVDVALTRAIRQSSSRDSIAGFTPAILEFEVPQLVERLNARMAALPPGTTVDMSGVGRDHEWLTHGVTGAGIPGGTATPAAADDRHVPAGTISIERNDLMFDHEHQGGATLAEVSEAMATAAVPPEVSTARGARFLQQRSFVRSDQGLVDALGGFVAGAPAMVRVRIAAPAQGWDSLPTAFPVEVLPPHLESWTLAVWLSEPDHLPRPIKRQIELPRDGDSTECEFHFRAGSLPTFDGRLTVLHRGRIIQTAMLRAAVRAKGAPVDSEGTPQLEELAVIRGRLGELDRRRRYDLAFVANHDPKGRPLLTALSEKAAWVKDLTSMAAPTAEINKTLSPVAKSVADYADGLDGAKGRALLIQLAQHGGWLKVFLDEPLEAGGNNPEVRAAEYVQIVSTRADAVVPLEFVYDYAVPKDDAKICAHWRKALKDGKCPKDCDHDSNAKVCPMGFWGLRKVIERHAVTPALAHDGNVLYLQSEPARQSDTLRIGSVALLGSSKRVPTANVTKLKKVIAEHCGAPPKVAKTWDDWEEAVKSLRPNLIVALPHTDGKSTNVTLEIGDVAVKTITLKDTHVFPPPLEGHQAPLVALIGCDTAATADDYGNHVRVLRARGAGIVIGTIATVFGEHAATVAGKLVAAMLPRKGKPVRLGELIRAIRRESLRDNLLMPLCLVAFGDADWFVARKEAADG